MKHIKSIAVLATIFVAASYFILHTPRANADITSNLVGHWTFDTVDMSNGVALDTSGNGNHANLRNIATSTFFSSGRINEAFDFDGSDDFLNIPDSATLQLASSFTISMWINPRNLAHDGVYHTMIMKEVSGGECKYFLQIRGRGLSGGFHDGVFCEKHFTADDLLVNDVWQQLTVVFDDTADRVMLYIDGVEVKNDPETGSLTSSVGIDLRVGRWAGGGFWNGGIDDIRIYNRALSPGDITELYSIDSDLAVTTTAASSVTSSTITLNGSISAVGAGDATQSGFAFGTDPTLAATLATSTLGAQTGTASFSENMTGLSPGTTYYFRAYAINSAGTAYGSIRSVATSLNHPDITTGLLDHWTFDTSSISGSTVLDSGSASHNGTIVGSPTAVTGMIGEAFNFVGTSNYINFGDNGILDMKTEFTLSAWMKRGVSTAIIAVEKFNEAGDSTKINTYSDGRVYAVVETGVSNYAGFTDPSDTNWHLYTMVFDGSLAGNADRLKMYIDGSIVTGGIFNNTIPPATNNGPGNFSVGFADFTPSTNGSVDDVRIYDRALTASDIARLYIIATPPTLTTYAASFVSTSTMTLYGSIDSTGGLDATQSGFVYGTSPSLGTVIATSTLGPQTGTASFIEMLLGLTPNTTYYFKAYATNPAGTGYGSILSAMTTPFITAPTVSTQPASSVAETTAMLNGLISALGGENATSRGFQWGETVVYGASTTESGSFGTGAFLASLISLICNTGYHFRAYALNSANIGYGADEAFTTSPCPVPEPPPPPSGGGGGVSGQGGGFVIAPFPRPPEGGYVFYVTPDPTTDGYITLHFDGGPDATRISIADNPSFSRAINIDYVTSYNWIVGGGAGEKTLYVTFCNQYGRCSGSVAAKVTYAPPASPDGTPTVPSIEPSTPGTPLPSLENGWNLISGNLIYNFDLSPLPGDLASLVAKFPELARVFASLGIQKITDLGKLKNASFNLPVISDKRNLPSEIVVADLSDGLIPVESSFALNLNGEVVQKIETLAGKRMILSVKPDGPVESIEGYLLFKRKPETTVVEIPSNSQAAAALITDVRMANALTEPPTVQKELLISSFVYTDPDNDGIYTAEITAPVVAGEYEVLTVINYKDPSKGARELRMITLVDPEGYVFKSKNGEETRIPNVTVNMWSIINGQSVLWDARKYSQDNPQITDKTGTYSFLVPEGRYYVTASATGYDAYRSDDFDVIEGAGVHFNIEMKENGTGLGALLQSRMFLITIFGAALLVNVLNNRRVRQKLSIKQGLQHETI